MMMMVQERINAGTASFMKSSLVARIMCIMGSDLTQFFANNKSKIRRVTTNAVNKLAATPMVSVTPKPLTEPVPIQIRMVEEIKVVTCESKIVLKARL